MNVNNMPAIPTASLERGRAAAADPKLRHAAQQLEGAFVEQLFKAMRETVPEGGLMHGGGGEEIFSSLMDQHLAAEVPASWENGIGAAIVRQLRGASAPAEPSTPAPAVPGAEL